MNKRISLLFLSIILLASCYGQHLSKENDPTLHPYLVNTKPIKTINSKAISFYLNNKTIDENSKLFYKGQFAISDDEETFAICDSITTDNPITRPFYLYNFCRVLEISDGAISEVMGEYCTAYMVKFPCEFIKNVKSEENNLPIGRWLDFVAFEQYSKSDLENFIKQIEKKLSDECMDSLPSWAKIKKELDRF
jgi:hypothetical protein